MELETPAEEVEFEVELARKTGIDGLLRHLQVSQNSQRASDRFDRFDTCPSLSKFVQVCRLSKFVLAKPKRSTLVQGGKEES